MEKNENKIQSILDNVPLKVSLDVCIDMGALSAAIDCNLLEDGYWVEDNEEERQLYLDSIRDNVTRHVLETLEQYGVDLNLKRKNNERI